MKVLLINPPQPEKDLRAIFGKVGYILPYSLLCVATYLEANGVKTDIVDCVAEKMSVRELLEVSIKGNYDIVGVTSFTFTVPQAFESVRVIKEALPNTVTVLGGIHATVRPLESLEECSSLDYIVIGEGEVTFLSLVRQLEKGELIEDIPNIAYRKSGEVVLTNKVKDFVKVNNLPMEDYSLLKMDLYRRPHSGNYRVLPTYSFYASRGCPFLCSFCSANFILGKVVRYKDIDRAIEEIKTLVYEYGAKGLLFQDSTFTVNKRWVRSFCQRLVEENIKVNWHAYARSDCVDLKTLKLMKKAGCYQLTLGLESGNQETLDLLQKGTTVEQNREAVKVIKKVGINVGASFILGLPNEDIDDVLNTIKFAKEVKALFTQFYLPIPYPGTKLQEQCGVEDADWHNYDSRDFTNAVYVNKNFIKEEYKRLPGFAFDQYFFNVMSLVRLFLSVRSYYELKDRLQTLQKILVLHLKRFRK